ncbi:MAG TPA: hypothetical protein VHE34_08700 [Puia sp.]|uniref:hypothetical protein n=1 Tax=Puia sp. TaxID=2045100 RepID=UPI002B53A1B6|nr:hypothetical protein [Puia sp.]HVU95289.1 hypothetical protein [Puia sp.]
MILYAILRFYLPIGLMIGWVFYQLVIKRKSWDSIFADALTCCVFAAVWIFIAYLLTK